MDVARWTMGGLCSTLVVVRIIGIDLGEKRIGIAISDATGTIARPLKTLERNQSDAQAVELLRLTIAELSVEDPIGCVVVGLPTRLDGSDNPQTPRVKKVIGLLSGEVTIPVVTQDERLSSLEAEERLAARERDWRKRKAKLDAAAAAVILQDYLDLRRSDAPGAESQEEAD
jgi:putative holliday junction resolvase